MKRILILIPTIIVSLSCGIGGKGPGSSWVSQKTKGGMLEYKTTERGDHIMDFSHAGYMGGGVKLPNVNDVVTVGPVDGVEDYTAIIQEAVDKVSEREPVNGFRGAVRLLPGEYPCSESIRIWNDGVVLRGSGDRNDKKSTIRMFGNRHSAVVISGTRSRRGEVETDVSVKIVDRYIPSGSYSFNVDDASGFKAGDVVLICKQVTEKWIKFMHMDDLVRDGKPQTWIREGSILRAEREIAGIEGNKIVLSVPLSDSYDNEMTDDSSIMARVSKSNRVKQCGVENLRIVAPYQAVNHTEARYFGIRVYGEDCWLRDIDLYETMESVGAGGKRITFTNVNVIRKARHQGESKPAEFAPNATQILLDRCSVQADNVWYVAVGAQISGPIVLLNCRFEGNGRIEGHQRWSTGLLADNCIIHSGGIDFKNRGSMGSGHGWGMAWAVAWNCEAGSFVNQLPPGTCNWVIGCTGKSTPLPRPFDMSPDLPEGVFDQHGTHVLPQSLYLAQLKERLGSRALKNIGY